MLCLQKNVIPTSDLPLRLCVNQRYNTKQKRRNAGRSRKASYGTGSDCDAGNITTPDAVCVGREVFSPIIEISDVTMATCGTRFSANVRTIASRPLPGVIATGPNFHWMGQANRYVRKPIRPPSRNAYVRRRPYFSTSTIRSCPRFETQEPKSASG
jgi:hypothetical protein